jgi:hypothetical protein
MNIIVDKPSVIGTKAYNVESEPTKKNSEARTKMQSIKFTPPIQEHSTVIVPISMGRYNISEAKTKQYDDALDKLFKHTSLLLKIGFIDKVDIVSSAGLQTTNWSRTLANDIEAHFLKKHNYILSQQSNFFTWDQFIQSNGEDNYRESFDNVLKKSKEGSEWYQLMYETHTQVKASINLAQSLEYQRKEYAAILLMNSYDHLVYLGGISPAWAYLYHTFKTKKPLFTKAALKNDENSSSSIRRSDINHSIEMILSNIESTLLSHNISDLDKKRLVNSTLSILYAYAPDNDKNN